MDESTILSWLYEVKDPEIPVVSLVDLGVIRRVQIGADGHVTVRMTPTFSGCPAMDYMRRDVERVLLEHGVASYTVEMSLEETWSSNDVTERGRQALREFRLSPPPAHQGIIDLDILEYAECSHCGSHNTELRSPFGPTLCRALHYCHNCRQGFEQFKPV
ncbi:phenylacetate-CoA oxygenase subunit PaaJ [Hymenobacter sp. J193]|uniref:1,2-phenylacetyl-CoA epoxidase subunit PaaD n=1 Tax=Hymenobacter sp. J193 TaxID=2898429 RepID=UPI00215126AF|nr:1,2-phenylacetyl-CoA epoxidase subunit PaaD [Hymenobacter sp. J193]MCR5886708.1 phenylacetate-CoA oxygenase subunit PaaJ [Hymenobacter sp. J193]